MTEKNKKRNTMRQELRKTAEVTLGKIKAECSRILLDICQREHISPADLLKSLSEGSSKTATHNLVTQLANKSEADLIKIWNDQQKLALGEK